MVGKVERFNTALQVKSLSHLEDTADRCIYIEVAWSPQAKVACVPKCSVRVLREPRRINPLKELRAAVTIRICRLTCYYIGSIEPNAS
jgi:hypothetical protein